MCSTDTTTSPANSRRHYNTRKLPIHYPNCYRQNYLYQHCNGRLQTGRYAVGLGCRPAGMQQVQAAGGQVCNSPRCRHAGLWQVQDWRYVIGPCYQVYNRSRLAGILYAQAAGWQVCSRPWMHASRFVVGLSRSMLADVSSVQAANWHVYKRSRQLAGMYIIGSGCRLTCIKCTQTAGQQICVRTRQAGLQQVQTGRCVIGPGFRLAGRQYVQVAGLQVCNRSMLQPCRHIVCPGCRLAGIQQVQAGMYVVCPGY